MRYYSGALLIIAAVAVNENTIEREARERRVNEQTRTKVFKEEDKRDRMPVYIVGHLGGVSIVAGVVTLGTGKKKERGSYRR